MTKKNSVFVFITIGSIILLVFAIYKIRRHIEIDQCLDQGGKWNHKLSKCEPTVDISEIPYEKLSWKVQYDPVENYEYLSKGSLMDSISLAPLDLIVVLNKRPSECKLELLKYTADTVIIKVLNANYLTESMGSAGAFCYLGETVFTMTEHVSVNRVKLEFQYGSHAGPGVFSRDDFKELIRK